MSKVSVTKIKLDYLANCIASKSGESTPLTLDEMTAAVRSIPAGGGGIVISDTTDAAGGTVRTITAVAISGTKSITQNGTGIDVTGYAAVDVNVSGGSPSATQHTIYFEYADSTDTTINAWYDDAFISSAITATTPSTYGGKQVILAQLDGVTWYEYTPIPLNTELIDRATIVNGYVIDASDGSETASEWSCCSDYTAVDPTMTFAFVGYQWYTMGFYDSSKTFISSIAMMKDIPGATIDGNDYAHGTIASPTIPSGAAYVRISSYPTSASTSQLSLIRTA